MELKIDDAALDGSLRALESLDGLPPATVITALGLALGRALARYGASPEDLTEVNNTISIAYRAEVSTDA